MKTIRVVIDPVNDFGSVAGWKARELVIRCGGRPIWSRRRRAWCTNERYALDAIAAAEANGYSVSVTVLGGAP